MINKAKKFFTQVKKDVIWSRIFALSVVIIVMAGSSVPGHNTPRVFTLTPDKVLHCIEYATLGFFIFHWLRLEYTAFRVNKISMSSFFSGIINGCCG